MTEFRFEETEQTAKQALIELALSEQTHTRCLALLNDRRTKDILTKKNTDGIIAGAIYIACILAEERLPQHRIADVIEVSEATIRKYYTMLVKVLEIRGKND